MSSIHFFCQDYEFRISQPRRRRQWLTKCALLLKVEIVNLNYIFTSDEHLHSINVSYLKHDTLTDIITFDTSDDSLRIEGDIFISIPRIIENSEKFGVRFDEELSRVLIHGLLHLCGYKDKTRAQQLKMREAEQEFMRLF